MCDLLPFSSMPCRRAKLTGNAVGVIAFGGPPLVHVPTCGRRVAALSACLGPARRILTSATQHPLVRVRTLGLPIGGVAPAIETTTIIQNGSRVLTHSPPDCATAPQLARPLPRLA